MKIGSIEIQTYYSTNIDRHGIQQLKKAYKRKSFLSHTKNSQKFIHFDCKRENSSLDAIKNAFK